MTEPYSTDKRLGAAVDSWVASRPSEDRELLRQGVTSILTAGNHETVRRILEVLTDTDPRVPKALRRVILAAPSGNHDAKENFLRGVRIALHGTEFYRGAIQELGQPSNGFCLETAVAAASDPKSSDRLWGMWSNKDTRWPLVICMNAISVADRNGFISLLRRGEYLSLVRALATDVDSIDDVVALWGSPEFAANETARQWVVDMLSESDHTREVLRRLSGVASNSGNRDGLVRLLATSNGRAAVLATGETRFTNRITMTLQLASAAGGTPIERLAELIVDSSMRNNLTMVFRDVLSRRSIQGLVGILRRSDYPLWFHSLARISEHDERERILQFVADFSDDRVVIDHMGSLLLDPFERRAVCSMVGTAEFTSRHSAGLAELLRLARWREAVSRLIGPDAEEYRAVLPMLSATPVSAGAEAVARLWRLASSPANRPSLREVTRHGGGDGLAALINLAQDEDAAIVARGLAHVVPHTLRTRLLQAVQGLTNDTDTAKVVVLLTEPRSRSALVQAATHGSSEGDVDRLRTYLNEPVVLGSVEAISKRARENRMLEDFLVYADVDGLFTRLNFVDQTLEEYPSAGESSSLGDDYPISRALLEGTRDRIAQRLTELRSVGVNYPVYIDGEVMIDDDDILSEPPLPPGGFFFDKNGKDMFNRGRPGVSFTGAVNITTGKIYLHPVSASEHYPSIAYPLSSLTGPKDASIRNDPRTAYNTLLHGWGSAASMRPPHFQLAKKIAEDAVDPKIMYRLCGFTVSQGHGNVDQRYPDVHGPFQFRWRSRTLSSDHFVNRRQAEPGGEFTQGILSHRWASAIKAAMIEEFGMSEELAEVRRQQNAQEHLPEAQRQPVNLSTEFMSALITKHTAKRYQDIRRATKKLTEPMAPTKTTRLAAGGYDDLQTDLRPSGPTVG